jgi:alpha-beta hydrolase superfamily lysophospholipase
MEWIARPLVLVAMLAAGAPAAEEPREVSFATADGGTVSADLYGATEKHAVVLAHGAAFAKASWRPFAEALAAHGFRALAIDFRGYGRSTPGTARDGLFEDVLAAVRWLRREGASRVAVIGASMGGGAAAEAAVRARPGEIDGLVLLAPARVVEPARLPAGTLFVASEGEPAAARVRAQYDEAPEPKRLVLLPGTAHAQHVFASPQADRLKAVLLDFLSAR